ncbi:DUF4214 domain-containing protein [Candidatus Arthromitus sp. SFB-mouse]|uniref:DUF4214 domain-containing protein n=1 Tax=Candidatus Arthromitus sp. SFB-mouse TaxID=49118 RepID=UPI0002D4ABA1|nr:fibronectin type III domain-containing protein [Candidatus Arthromitus sp. SFB-mouse]
MGKTFRKFRSLAFFLCFMFIFEFLVLNFGIKSKEAKASTINAIVSIDYDFKIVDNKIAFDFTKSLSEGDSIESIVLKKGESNLNIKAHDKAKKIWTTDVLFEKAQYELNITLNTNNSVKKLISTFYYEDYEMEYFVPVVKADGNNLKITGLTNWANKFLETDGVIIDILASNGTVVIPEVTKTIKECKSDIVLTGAKSKLTNLRAYVVRARLRESGTEFNRIFLSEYTADSNNVARQMNSKIKSITRRDNGNYDIDVSVYYNVASDASLYIYYAGSSLGSTSERESNNKKIFKFQDIPITLGTRCFLKEGGSAVREDYLGFYEKTKLDASKINCESLTLINDEARGVKIKLNKSMRDVFSTTGGNNKVVIYELNDNLGKTKIAEQSSINSLSTNNINLNNDKVLEKGKAYFIEFTNGEKSFGQSFIYYPINSSASEIKETSVKITWSYPSGYIPASGDRVEIFLRDKASSDTFSSIPKLTLAHGNNGVNFSNTSSTVVTGMAPGTNYEAKIVLYNQRAITNTFVDFTTLPFALTNFIEVENCQYRDAYYREAWPRNREVNITWDFEPTNMQFNEGDKVEIFIKPNGSGAFSGYPNTINSVDSSYSNPVFSATQNLNSVKRATIKMPSWEKNYHVDLIYTIGGKQIITNKPSGTEGEDGYNRRTINSRPGPVTINIIDQKQTSAKIVWQVDTGDENNEFTPYQPENGHLVKVHLRKVNSLNDTSTAFYDPDKIFEYVYGQNWNYSRDPQEYMLENLEPDQCYRARIQHLVQFPENFNGASYAGSTAYFNFKTEAFSITSLNSENQTDDISKVKLKWETQGEVEFGEDDKLEVFLKESTSSEYPETPIQNLNLNPSTSKEATIEVPRFNTLYNAKVEYTIKGKKISKYVLVQVDAELNIDVTDIKTENSNWTAKVKWTYPNGYNENNRTNDKVKLTVTKKEESTRNSSLPNNEEIAVTTKEKTLTGLEANATYDVTLKFLNDGQEVYSTSTSFKATTDLQIVGLNTSNVKTKTGTINWSFSPGDKSFSNSDKVEIFIKENTKTSRSDDLSNFTKIYTMTQGASTRSGDENIVVLSSEPQHSEHVDKTGDLKTFKSLDLKNLGVNKDYTLKVRYTMTESGSREGERAGETKTSEAEVKLKTQVDELKATVYVSNQTSATFGWEYPPEYELQEGDKIEIFVKELSEEGGNSETRDSGIGTDYSDPLLTLTHASSQNPEEGKYDMNEVTAVDVSGLTPERRYKSKIKFTMGTGEDSYFIEKEVDISTKSFEIKSFEMDSYQEYDILVNWTVEPENMVFNPADTLKIFVKLASEDTYPDKPEYSLRYEENDAGKSINNTFGDYVLAHSLGVDQKMKLEYKVGERTYEKELEFNNKINPIKAEATEVNETRALISITPPDNYEFVSGDKLLIYAMDEFSDGDLIDENNLVFEGVQTDTANITDMTLIELSYLLPEAKYDIAIVLDLEDGYVEPVQFELTTTGLSLTDIKLEQLKYNEALISWNYGKNAIDFFEDSDYSMTDKLIIAHKESDGTPMPEDINLLKQLSNTEYLGEKINSVGDASIKIEDPSKDYDVAVCYDLGGLLYMKTFKASYLSASVDEASITSEGAKINWKYPTNITFGDADKTEVFVRKSDETNYPDSASLTSTGSGTTSGDLTGLEGGASYIAKVQITKEGLQIDPFEVTFETQAGFGEETIIEEIPMDIQGTAAEFVIPAELPVDTSGTISLSMGDEVYQGFTATFNEDGTGFTIAPTIPKKVYTNIELEIPLENGSTHKIIIPEFTTQPEDLAQDWLSNAYWFAFERFPDEEGYNYWYAHRMKPKTLNGEYFLKNLMFAEDEFTNRNLADNDLIAALYQIVVNREYDQGGLEFWIGIYNENLQNAQGNKKLAQEVLVDRMVHEPEFGKLCDKVGIFWRQQDQDAAGVVA